MRQIRHIGTCVYSIAREGLVGPSHWHSGGARAAWGAVRGAGRRGALGAASAVQTAPRGGDRVGAGRAAVHPRAGGSLAVVRR